MQQLEVVVLPRWYFTFVFFFGSLSFVDRTLQIIFLVQSDVGGEQVVHNHKADILVGTLITK